MSRFSEILGIERRVVVGLTTLSLLAAGVGFVVAAGLDDRGSGAIAIAAPAPVVSPDAIDPEAPSVVPPPQELPDVVIPGPSPTPAPPPAPATPTPEPDPPPQTLPTTPPVATPTPSPPTPPKTTGSTTKPPSTPPPTPTTPPGPKRPSTDAGDPVPFRPQPATQPLPQVVVPDAEYPADAATATATLRTALARAPATGPTRADIRRVLAVADRFATTSFAGRRATLDRMLRMNAWWFGRRRAPAGRMLARDPSGLIYSYSAGQGFAVNPVGTSGRWQRLNSGFTAAQLAAALLELGVVDTRGGRATLSWEYYDVPDEPAAIRPGVSAMAQARLAHLMANAARETGDPRFVAAAVDAMASMAVPVDAGGTRSMVAFPRDGVQSPWYVERAYPGADPWKGGALNGFMVAILELRAAERALRAPNSGPTAAGDAAANEARRLADEGAASLDRLLPAHDTGDWSYYGLLTPGKPFRTYRANATYHCFHVSLLRDLTTNYPAATFAATASKWSDYATRSGVTCPAEAPATG